MRCSEPLRGGANLGFVRRLCAHPMNRALVLLLAFAISAQAQVSPVYRWLYDFQDDDVSLALRVLARQGNFKVIIAGKISGTVTLRVDQKTPREVFDLIVARKHLAIDQRDGVLYVRTRSLAQPPTHSPK